MSEFEELLQAQEQQVNLENDLMEDMMMPSLDKVIRTAAGNVMVDQSPLQPQLQKNKESLEKKLLARRPMTTLVEQGIVPEYKTSPSLHLQRTKLERAKTGDILKSKISLRPERTELVHRHILEDVRADVDPSLCDRQRQLKRAKLADSLASQLSHRPGPLELIQKNILHTDETVETAVKEGTLQFRPTTQLEHRTPVPQDEDSSDTAPSPLVDTSAQSPVTRDTSSPTVSALLAQFSEINNRGSSVRSESLGDITSVVHKHHHDDLIKSDIFGGSGGNLSVAGHEVFNAPNQHREAPGKERKKLKAKSVKPGTAPKPTTFKFHEYKGPPESLKRKKPEKKKDKSGHDILLEQQQLLLQWQVENKNKYQMLLPAPVKSDSGGRASTLSVGTSSTSGYMSGASSSCASSLVTSPTSSIPGTPRSTTPRESTPTRFSSLTPQDVNNATSLLAKLDAMKVSDLKIELKKRNLPISGSKPALIEKLKPALESVIAAGKKQFKQPYKQIHIASGGLIILKPSPNSQLLTSEGKEKTPEAVAMSPASAHESTPEMESETVMTPLMLPLSGDVSQLSSLGLLGLLSPSESVHSIGTNSEIEQILTAERRDSLHSLHSNNDSEFSLGLRSNDSASDFSFSFMDVEQQQSLVMPPPAPPPPPPPQTRNKTSDPRPLPPPPAVVSVTGAAHQQFLPPKQTSQQILAAKAALEAQLTQASDVKPSSNQSCKTTRQPGPKGQFIWPPVSVESSQGTMITIRAETAPVVTSAVTSAAPVRNESVSRSSVSVSQLAAVFSQSQPATSLPMFVSLPQEPLSPSELGLSMTVTRDNLPATLPAPVTSDVMSDAGDNMAEDIIKAQQQRIAELERALHDRSNHHQPQQQQIGFSPAQQQQPAMFSPQVTVSPAQQQNSNIVNTKHLLAQQIHNKQNNVVNRTHEAMEDVIDSLLKREDLPESVQNLGVKVPEKPPSPPPLPSKSSPNMFPQLDLADMSFDFGLGPDLEDMLDATETNNVDPVVDQQRTGNSNMDVDMDMDVQDWLDSLVVPLNTKLHPDLSSQYKEKKNDIKDWAHGV